MSIVKLDGRTLEGGGQLLRNALCLSALTGTPVEIDNIRGNRSSGGGLKAQHLACVNWLALACDAKVTGGEKGSKVLLFAPGGQSPNLSPAFKQMDDPKSFESTVDIGTAGSTGLVLQAVLPYVFFAPPRNATRVRLTVRGGTNVSGSPSYEYLTQVLLPTLEAIGLPAMTSSLQSRGWSTGRATPGSFVLDIPVSQTRPLPAFELRPSDNSRKPAKPAQLRVTFLGPRSCFEHLRIVLPPAIQHYFGQAYKPDTNNMSITCEDSGDDKRLYLIIVATVPSPEDKIKEYRLARDWLYDRKVRSVERAVTEMSERVAADMYDEWRSGAWVDEHMRDQLVIFQALSEAGSSVWPGRSKDGEIREPSLHARTAEWVAKKMLGVHFSAEDSCTGIGFTLQEELSDRIAGLKLDS